MKPPFPLNIVKIIGMLILTFFAGLFLVRFYIIVVTKRTLLESCKVILGMCINVDYNNALATLGSTQCMDAQICVNRGVMVTSVDRLYLDFFDFISNVLDIISNLFKSWFVILTALIIFYIVGTKFLNYFIITRNHPYYLTTTNYRQSTPFHRYDERLLNLPNHGFFPNKTFSSCTVVDDQDDKYQ